MVTYPDPIDLDAVLAHRRWVRRTAPFDHVVAQNVFQPEFYASLAEHFEKLKAEGAFSNRIKNYDAASTMIREHADGAMNVFLTREWHDLVAGLFGVRATGDVSAGLHHHPPGGRPGWPHNDLNPGWFAGDWPNQREIRNENAPGVDYQQGPNAPHIPARETMRAVAVLFYLNNPTWSPGDGGETGIYASASDARAQRGVGVPPINNSLVMFECTPFSWHAYAGNSRHERNSVVMWVHRRKEDVVERWGERSIQYWRTA